MLLPNRKASFAMPRLFSYGTLQQRDVQLSTFGGELVAATGKTHHANVTFNDRNESRVSVTVFEISDAELAAADQYDRLAAYTRVTAILASGKQAWVYVDARSAPLQAALLKR